MIVGVIGNRGSGKTLFMCLEAFNHYRKGKRVISNFKLNFPKLPNTIKPELVKADFFINFDKYNFKNSAIFFDEIYVYIDSRTSGSTRNRIMSLFFNQTRKTGVDLYFSTQFFSQVDKRLRYNTEMFVLPKCFNINKEKYIIIEICNRDLKLLQKWRIKAKAIYNLYDTDEIIKLE